MSVKSRLARLGVFFTFTFEVIWTIILILTSYVFNRPMAGHALKIGHISLRTLSLHDVRYSGALYDRDYKYAFSTPVLSIAFHLPRPSYPRWLTLSSHTMYYTATTSDLSVTTLDVTLWVFPYLFKRTAGPWISVTIDGFRIRVHKSNATPYWIQRLRQNVVAALFEGEVYRLDDFSTSVRFAGLSESYTPIVAKTRRRSETPLAAATPAPNENHHGGYDDESSSECDSDFTDGDGDENGKDPSTDESERGEHDHEADAVAVQNHQDCPPPFTNTDSDELRVSVAAQQLHLTNNEGRVYTFGRLDAQLRRNWNVDRGSFVMIAEEARWVRVHWPYQRQVTPWWSQIFTSILQFPLDVIHILSHPMSTVNIFAPRTDIIFDEFRIRDAELIVQGLTMLRAKTARAGINWGDVFFDAFVQACIQP